MPSADASPDDSHWTGVAYGGFFEVVLFFDPTLYVKAQVNIPMARTMEGEVGEMQGHPLLYGPT